LLSDFASEGTRLAKHDEGAPILLTVVVTVFEQLRTLPVLLECLEAQTYSDAWEVIVTDDGSLSDTNASVKSVAARKIVDVRYAWQPNRGFRAAAARNNGINLARGDIIVFLDGDMIVPPDFLREHALLHTRERLLVCGTRRETTIARQEDLRNLMKAGPIPVEKNTEASRQQGWLQSDYKWMALLACNFSVRKTPELLFDENFVGWGCEDTELAYRLVHLHGYDVCASSKIEGIHVGFSARPDSWNPLRNPNATQDLIWNCMRSLVYLVEQYPSADFTPITDALQFWHVHAATDEIHFDPTGSSQNSLAALTSVKEWLSRNSWRYSQPVARKAREVGSYREA
jgi:glycosyltransferase involved in cell wall biosynthesis